MIAMFFPLLEKAFVISNKKYPYRDEDIFPLFSLRPDNWIDLND